MSEHEKKKAKILIVDDVESNRIVLKNIVSEMGYQPILAENGVRALKLVPKMRPQLIILDVAMPEMDGHEVCKILKKDPLTRNIPIIFISAYDNPEDVVEGFNAGGEDYITKPFLPEVVKARVGLHLKLHEATIELSEINRMLQKSVNEQLYQLEMEKKNVLYALTRVARENAAYDEKNMERISYNCRILAEAMQLSPKFFSNISDVFIETIEVAAPLSDLGNVGVPTAVLQKKTALTEDEIVQVRKHTEVGARILKDIQITGDYNDFLEMSYEIASYHHENYDGSGYPTGRSGDAIPLAAQIVGVVSNYCALTESRVYREAYSTEQALAMMEKDSGRKYNPDIIDILKMIVRQLK